MRNHFRIAFAALAIGGVALPPASEAQKREAADAAETLAQPDAGADADVAPAKPDTGADSTDAPSQADAGADSADAPTQTDAGDDAAEPTWEAVIQVIQEALAPELMAETREAADAAAAFGPTEGDADGAEALAQADAEAFVTEPVSEAAIQVTNWVIASGDNDGLPFIVIDKVTAALLVFGPDGALLGESPALLGVSSGDEFRARHRRTRTFRHQHRRANDAGRALCGAIWIRQRRSQGLLGRLLDIARAPPGRHRKPT